VNEKSTYGQGVEFVITGDGSHTLYVPGLEENYHSVFGAIAESRHIFIEAGLKYVSRSSGKINILEVGFGTGLNALLTLLEAEKSGYNIDYTTIEPYPLTESVVSGLNYPDMLNNHDCQTLFYQLHSSSWNTKTILGKTFSITKMQIALQDFSPQSKTFDLVYFDAFGPDVQPEMWTQEMFDKIASGMKQGGVLVTYSTKGIVKRNLKQAGFSIEKLPGPKGKREILRATRI